MLSTYSFSTLTRVVLIETNGVIVSEADGEDFQYPHSGRPN